MGVIYWWGSNTKGTERLAQRLSTPTHKIQGDTIVNDYYVLMTPTYGSPTTSHVPKIVQQFLNNNGNTIIGVIGTGNTNFGKDYCKAAHIISNKYQVPILHRVELMGTTQDIQTIDQGIAKHWQTLKNMKKAQNGMEH